MNDEHIAELKQQALAARARGDWEAERNALDQLALIERLEPTCKGMATNGLDDQDSEN